jgi:hypothetical protein
LQNKIKGFSKIFLHFFAKTSREGAKEEKTQRSRILTTEGAEYAEERRRRKETRDLILAQAYLKITRDKQITLPPTTNRSRHQTRALLSLRHHTPRRHHFFVCVLT